MIQRIQTIYLLIALIFIGLLFLMPTAQITVNNEIFDFYTSKVVKADDISFNTWNWMSLILNVFTFLMNLSLIFLYKKRFLQLRLCVVNIVLLLGLFLMMWLQIGNVVSTFETSMQLDVSKQLLVAFGFPLISGILTWLAIRGIIKDITLIKSYDRIR